MKRKYYNSLLAIVFLLPLTVLFPVNRSIVESKISKNYLLGKVNPKTDSNFILIETKYTHKSNLYMHTEAYRAFNNMHKAAQAENINLNIVSAFRSYNHQKSIWEAKWSGRRKVLGKNLSTTIPEPKDRAIYILQYSSMPGTSRHHWGTDIDIYSVNDKDFQSGSGKKIYDWLKLNASIFGFCQTYNIKSEERKNGYEEEKWHWSYMPLASKYSQAYKSTITYNDIQGFEGANTAKTIDVITNYVLSINSRCK